MGKPEENHSKTIESHRKPWENGGLPSGYVKIAIKAMAIHGVSFSISTVIVRSYVSLEV